MKRRITATATAVLIAAAGTAWQPPVEAAQTGAQGADKQTKRLQTEVKRLRAQVRALTRERSQLRRERDRARRAIGGDLAARVTQVAAAGSLSELHRLVLEPIRASWPCGATLFQGNTLYSLDVGNSDFTASGDKVLCP